MIKKLSKILLIIFFIIILIILYLSFIGVKTGKFNERINNRILKINKNINLELKEVKFLLNPYNLTINVTTKKPKILLEGNQILIKEIKTKISLKSLIFDKFSINDLEIRTQEIKLNALIKLGRSFKNSTELFLLDRFIKDGFLIANIKLNFDANGKIKDNYQINGFVKNSEFALLNKFNGKNLNFDFEISKNKYTLKKVSVKFNDIDLSFPLIEANENNNLFLFNGKVETNEKDLDINQLDILFDGLMKKLDIEKINLSSVNKFSFNINKKLRLNDINIDSKINLKKLVIKKNLLGVKSYLPNYEETAVFENHKVVINFTKNKFNIKGNGKVVIASRTDSINYNITKNNDQFKFDINVNLKNNKLLIDFLDFEKKEKSDSLISIKGLFKKNNQIKFDLISLEEKNNKILLKDLNLDKEFKVISIDLLELDYKNKKMFETNFF